MNSSVDVADADALSKELCHYLERYLFDHVVSENHIAARNRNGRTLFIVMPCPDEVRTWPAVRGMTTTPGELKGFLYYLRKYWGVHATSDKKWNIRAGYCLLHNFSSL